MTPPPHSDPPGCVTALILLCSVWILPDPRRRKCTWPNIPVPAENPGVSSDFVENYRSDIYHLQVEIIDSPWGEDNVLSLADWRERERAELLLFVFTSLRQQQEKLRYDGEIFSYTLALVLLCTQTGLLNVLSDLQS